jgi:hypothetical protein
MFAFDSSALLSAWEEASSGPPAHRAVTLLAAAWPETTAREWARLRIGARDGALLDLQDGMFGPSLEATASCPRCAELVELAFTTEQVRTPAPTAERLTVTREGYTIECRLPNSEDLLRLPRESVEAARTVLLARCIERAARGECAVAVEELPPGVLQAVVAEMAEADPQAEVRIAIACPECGHRWSMDFDIASYLWDEVRDWAHRLLRDVHALASAYGWSEREVLGLSAHRRRLYLDMVEG